MSQRHRITAIIFDKRGRILSTGRNRYDKTHPYQAKLAKQAGQKDRIYLHAEVDAIIRCRNRRAARRILVLRFGRDGTPRLAKPCPICQMAIREAGIKEIEYTK